MEISRRSLLRWVAVAAPTALSVTTDGGATGLTGMAHADVPRYPVFSQADIAKALTAPKGRTVDVSGEGLKLR
jgi:hypothetical protein